MKLWEFFPENLKKNRRLKSKGSKEGDARTEDKSKWCHFKRDGTTDAERTTLASFRVIPSAAPENV